MTDDRPDWFPTADEDIDPEPQQKTIIKSEAYPMRVLAGAGTGKTFTMVRKIEHLIDEQDVSPDQILALTFTNNAADSMREKLNAKLGTAGYDVDAYTYHSICNEILSDYAYEAGVDPDFDVATDAEKYGIILDVLDEIDYRYIKPNVYGPDSYGSGAASKLLSFIGSMKRSGISPADVDEFLGPADRLYDLADIPERIGDSASDNLGGRSVGSVLDGIPAVRADIEAERDNLSDYGVEQSIADFLARLSTLCDALETAFEEHERGDRPLPEDAHKLPKYLLGGYASGAPSGIPDDLDLELVDYLDDYLDDCLVARDLQGGYAAYEQELEERDLLDFDSLVVETVRLLQSGAADEIADRWDYVFCDEFQDTDRLQFDLVTSLVSEERLFVVGDDDQAIYEWRGANVANITSELDRALGETLTDEPLEENFRSRQPILDLANAALDRLDERSSEKTLTRVDEPEYDGDTVAVVEEADEEEDRAQQLATVVRNLLTGEADSLDKTYDAGDIALLVRKNAHAEPVLDVFDDLGIPYQVAGDLATDSVGVGTVVAYLKALARPEEDEVSWNRVLSMRYRVSQSDLHHLNTRDETLLAALLDAPLSEFDEPERISEARAHAETLLDLRETASLAHLYRELKDLTDIEWYLSEQERRDLTELDDVVEQFGDEDVQPTLTPGFIESLQHYDSLFAESGSTPTDQPDLADDAVNVMTIHKSKGLDFPVVLMPRLTAEEWAPSSRSYDVLEKALSTGPEGAFAEDFVARDARETRRVLHVGLTRAEDILVLQGGTESDDEEEDAQEGDQESERPMFETVDSILPDDIPWKPAADHLPIWTDLQECLSPQATDWTETLASDVAGTIGGQVTYDDETLAPDDGQSQLLALARDTVDGQLTGTAGQSVLHLDALDGPRTPTPAMRHSYTSLEAYETCPRQHYLDYVVNAFTDYYQDEDSDDGVSQRDIGLLFHDTAETAAKEGATTPKEWYEICERLASQQRATDALSEAKTCIDRYFELEVSDWEIVDAEREFQISLDGHELVGYIDAVFRNPAGELVVIDYKATARHRDIEDNMQLPLYLLACRDLYEDPVETAGYAYVGELGPKLELRSFDTDELEETHTEVATMMNSMGQSSFQQYDAASHCQWCRHNELPCADEVDD